MSAHVRISGTYYTLSTGFPTLCPAEILKNLHVLSRFHSLQMLVNMLCEISFPSRKCFIFIIKILHKICHVSVTVLATVIFGFHSHWEMNSLSFIFLNIFFLLVTSFLSAYLKRTQLNILFIVFHSSLQSQAPGRRLRNYCVNASLISFYNIYVLVRYLHCCIVHSVVRVLTIHSHFKLLVYISFTQG